MDEGADQNQRYKDLGTRWRWCYRGSSSGGQLWLWCRRAKAKGGLIEVVLYAIQPGMPLRSHPGNDRGRARLGSPRGAVERRAPLPGCRAAASSATGTLRSRGDHA
jgi:hypothetical protein